MSFFLGLLVLAAHQATGLSQSQAQTRRLRLFSHRLDDIKSPNENKILPDTS